MPVKITALLLGLCCSLLLQAQSYVTLYEDCRYSGRRAFLEPGNYRLIQMQIGNDRLSSLQVPPGLRVTIYADDNFRGASLTLTADTECLEPAWDNVTSSLVVESTGPQFNPNDYVVFYNDCFQRGFSRTLRPGTYTGNDLANLKYNISSFSIFGNLQVRAYVHNENASGFHTVFSNSENCLSASFNDKIGSLVIEPRSSGWGGDISRSFVSLFADCQFGGNSMRLEPGMYTGDKLGLFRFEISSVEIPQGMRIRAYTSEDLGGNSLVLSNDISCLNSTLNNRIGSLLVENSGFSGPGISPPAGDAVMLYADAGYRGTSVRLLPGSYRNMTEAGFPDNALSSINVPAGFRVILYDLENFGGRSLTVTDSRSNFGISGWNDRTSSLLVIRDRP